MENDTNEVNDFDSSEDNLSGSFGSSKTEYSYPMLVMEAVADCRRKRAVEMIKGYWDNKLDKFGNSINIYHPDNRLVYISAVKALNNLMKPKYDEQYNGEVKNILDKMKSLQDSYSYEDLDFSQRDHHGNRIAAKTGKKYLPSIGSTVYLKTRAGYEPVQGGWDGYVNSFIDECLELYDDMFAELNCLIDRIGYFKKRAKFG